MSRTMRAARPTKKKPRKKRMASWARLRKLAARTGGLRAALARGRANPGGPALHLGLRPSRGTSTTLIRKGPTTVVRNIGFSHPLVWISLGFLVQKPCKTAEFSILLNPLRFWCKKCSKRPTPKSSFLRVRRQVGCLSLYIRSFSVKNRLQTLTVLLTSFPARKSRQIPSRRACHRLSPLRHRSPLFWAEKVRKSGQVPEFQRTSFFAGFSVARQPAEDLARDATACRGPRS